MTLHIFAKCDYDNMTFDVSRILGAETNYSHLILTHNVPWLDVSDIQHIHNYYCIGYKS